MYISLGLIIFKEAFTIDPMNRDRRYKTNNNFMFKSLLNIEHVEIYRRATSSNCNSCLHNTVSTQLFPQKHKLMLYGLIPCVCTQNVL